jgi:hypothetical protein
MNQKSAALAAQNFMISMAIMTLAMEGFIFKSEKY